MKHRYDIRASMLPSRSFLSAWNPQMHRPQQLSLCLQNDWSRPLSENNDSLKPIVALGKFDALHKGHAALAEQACRLGGQPWLISFSGMAQVLGWPERLPLVAPSDRPRVLAQWARSCGGVVPLERSIPFDQVRHLTPIEFVDVLAQKLKAAGVVVGSNYRFGYKAAGTTETLQHLGQERGLIVSVVDLLGICEIKGMCAEGETSEERVSSTRVREALSAGDMATASKILARPYRLVAGKYTSCKNIYRVDFADLENQPPGEGTYSVVVNVGESVREDEVWVPGTARIHVRGGTIEIESNQLRNEDGRIHIEFTTTKKYILSKP